MIQTIRNAWAVPELRKKMLFTVFALLIFRLGSAIPVPYIDSAALESHLALQSGTILGLMNAMSGSIKRNVIAKSMDNLLPMQEK